MITENLLRRSAGIVVALKQDPSILQDPSARLSIVWVWTDKSEKIKLDINQYWEKISWIDL